LEVRFAQVSLQPPKNKKSLGKLTLWAVLAQEVEAPSGIGPVRWMLLTTCPVESFEAACEKLRWYTLRWGIEVYHRTLKSGCQIEQRQLGAADRIEACLAIDLVVAWRIFHLAKLGREIPDVPCMVYFEDAEWKALVAYITRNPVPPAQPPSLREAMRMVATLGVSRAQSRRRAGNENLVVRLVSRRHDRDLENTRIRLTHPLCPAEDMGKDQPFRERRMSKTECFSSVPSQRPRTALARAFASPDDGFTAGVTLIE
jgi:hypothetical protein